MCIRDRGSAEAVKQSLEKISNDEVRVKVIHTGVGAVNKSDVMLALSLIHICPVTWKKVGVYAVTDEQLAVLCRRSLEQNKEDNA